MSLSDIKCRTAKPKAKSYKLGDTGGLYMQVSPNGSKYWRMKYRFPGICKKTGEPKNLEKLLSLGTYPLISLAEAREERDKAKKLLSKNIDPAEAKKQEKRQITRDAQNSFKAVALEWHEIQAPRWSKNHANNIMLRLERDIFPEIGRLPISKIEAPDLLDALRKIEKRGALDVLARARQICGQIFRYGIQTGRCKRNPANDLAGKGVFKTKKTEHFAAIEAKDIPELLRALDNNEARLYNRTRRAIKLSMLTFLRPGELRKGRWEEIDWENKQWMVPKERMKMKRPHIVPLSDQAIEILKEQQEETGYINTPFIFPSPAAKQPSAVISAKEQQSGPLTNCRIEALSR